MEMAAAEFYLDWLHFVNDQIENKIEYLTKSGCQCSAFNTQCRERTKAKDQQRIKNDIGNTADQKPDHRNLHFANALEDLFVSKVKRIYRCKQKNNCRITDSKVNDICITSKKCQKSRHHKDTTDCQNYTMQTGQCKPVCGCFAGSLSVSGTKTDGNL